MSFLLTENEDKVEKKTISTTGKILLGLTGSFAVGLSIICVPFVSPALRKICLPYVPATSIQVANVFQGLKNRSGKLIDLGSGDGRIVIEGAKRGFEAHGVELNPWLVAYSYYSRIGRKFLYKPKFYRTDLWKFNLSPYNNVVIFGVDEMMLDLEKKICKEVETDTVIVACRFPLPNMKPFETIGTGIDTVWIYKR